MQVDEIQTTNQTLESLIKTGVIMITCIRNVYRAATEGYLNLLSHQELTLLETYYGL